MVVIVKRVLSMFLAFVIMSLSTIGTTAFNVIKGDTNNDGEVLAIDAREILIISVGKKDASDLQMALCDMDGNGELTTIDAQKILKIAVGNEISPSVDEKALEVYMTSIIEEEFLKLVNAERVRIGVKPLVKNSILKKAATVRAGENIGSLSHTRPNGELYSDILKNEFTYEYKHSGENLAYVITGPHSSTDYSVAFDEASLKALAKQFYDMLSDDAPHYNNMMRDYFEETGVGIAFYKNESKKTIKVVCCHLFGTPA